MGEHLLELGIAIVAAIIVMVVHELPKTIVYYNLDKDSSKKSLLYALRIQHYIDPIGLIFCVTTFGGFSKPYLYHIKDKRMNKILGMTGYLSLTILYVMNIALLKYVFGVRSMDGGYGYDASMGFIFVILMRLCLYIATMSIGMLFVNLFPIATFDMGNIIAGISPMKFFEYFRRDYFMKIILIFVLIFGLITNLCELTLMVLLR